MKNGQSWQKVKHCDGEKYILIRHRNTCIWYREVHIYVFKIVQIFSWEKYTRSLVISQENDSYDGKYNMVTEGCKTWWCREVQHGDGGKYDMVPLFFHFYILFLDSPFLYIFKGTRPEVKWMVK
jgi:hypothetical protein